MLTSSCGTNYVPHEHEHVDQYGYPESLVNQNEIPIDLLC